MCLSRQIGARGWWLVFVLAVSGCGGRRTTPLAPRESAPITAPVVISQQLDAGERITRDEPRLPPPAWSDPSGGEMADTRERTPQARQVIASEIGASGKLAVPVAGLRPNQVRDTYDEMRGSQPHRALDIAAKRGAPVVAVDDGRIRKLFTSNKGGLTIYQFDTQGDLCYYYAHLESYAEGLNEGDLVRRGEVIGYVGTSGNAPKDAPHLHFEVTRVGPQGQWYGGEPMNPYPMMVAPE